MAKFRKKPIEIEAFQWSGELDASFFPRWFRSALECGTVYYQGGDAPYYIIEKPEGDVRASIGDYIIQGVKGEIYPCKPDIFKATYEAV